MQETDSTSQPPATSVSLPEGKDYHAFICFNIADQEWVDKTIAHLESPQIGFKCVDHRRDFHAGRTTIKNIEEFIEKSWKYILILSPDFVTSEWCSFETDIMLNMSLEQQQESIIPVLLKPCAIPKSLKSLTYIDVSQKGWPERLVRDIKRADISTKTIKSSKFDVEKQKQRVRENAEVYQQCIDNHRREKKRLELERKSLERDVHNVFALQSKRFLDELERKKVEKLNDINDYMDKRLAALVRKSDIAEKLLASAEKDLDDDAQGNLRFYQDEIEELERRRRETTYTEFVISPTFLEILTLFDVGYLREKELTLMKSQEDRDNFLREIKPSWAILPHGTLITPWTTVSCRYFRFDPETVMKICSILPDGSLSNQSPRQTPPPSDKRLENFHGVLGTTTFTSGSIYYWENNVYVHIERKMGRKNMVFEVGLSMRGVIDDKFDITNSAGTLTLYVNICKEHSTESVCLKVRKGESRIHHQKLHTNITGELPPLRLGFLLDTIRHRWTVYDVTKKEKITAVDGIPEVEEFTPMFGVYAHLSGPVKVSLITGTDLDISDDMLEIIHGDLE